jgi:hypothetical protein
MCRSIKRLRVPERATNEEIRAAALQFVRKVSGFHKPSKANEAAFQLAIDEIAGATQRLLDQLPVPAPAPAPASASVSAPEPTAA